MEEVIKVWPCYVCLMEAAMLMRTLDRIDYLSIFNIIGQLPELVESMKNERGVFAFATPLLTKIARGTRRIFQNC